MELIDFTFPYLLLTTVLVFLRAKIKGYRKWLWSTINIAASIPTIAFGFMLFMMGAFAKGMAGGKSGGRFNESTEFQVIAGIYILTPFIVFLVMEMVNRTKGTT